MCGSRSIVDVEVEVNVMATSRAQLQLGACLEHLDVVLARTRAWVDATRGAVFEPAGGDCRSPTDLSPTGPDKAPFVVT